MDKELKTYLIEKCRNWMLPEEIKALEQLNLNESSINDSKKSKLAEKKMELVYGVGDEKTEKLVALGKEMLEEKIVNRLLKENSVFINKCPKCGKLARTPKARQCRFCSHKLYENKVGGFKLNSSFQMTGGHFYITGEILNGKVEIGNFIDLTFLGINIKPEIKKVELILKKTDGTETDDIGLGTDELTEIQKEILINTGSLDSAIDILNNR